VTPAHLALLGDSIFANGAYTRGAPDVLGHLNDLLPATWRATLLAVDGSTIASLPSQLKRLPTDTTHLALAIGGNDVLANRALLGMPAKSMRGALELFADRAERFEADYRNMLREVVTLRRPTLVCTIYNGRLDPPEARAARMALTMFNDAILRSVFEHNLSALDLRLVCSDPADYENSIEPSARGGQKIARALAGALGLTTHPAHVTHVYWHQ
jgi:hypothetical protein